MTKYEMIQHLLNEEDFRKRLIDQQSCDDVRFILHETDNLEYLLQVNLIYRIFGEDITVISCEFEFGLTKQDTLTFFMIRFNELLYLKAAKTSVEIGEMIEDFLGSRLN